MWVCVCVGFVMCGCVYVWVLYSLGVLVICILMFTMFCVVCTGFLYCFVNVYLLLLLFVLSVLVSKNYCHRLTIAVSSSSSSSSSSGNSNNSNNNNNNNNNNVFKCFNL